MSFSIRQIEEMLEIINLTSINFIGENVGRNSLSKIDKMILKSNGIKYKDFKKKGYVFSAFRFGLLADSLGNENAKKLTYVDFKKYLEKGNFIPLTIQQKKSIEFIEHRLSNDIKGLSNKIQREISNINDNNVRKNWTKYSKRVEEKTREAIINNSSTRELALGIQGNTEKWGRDFDRIADYNLHEAFDQGKAHSILQKHGENSFVYKDVYNGACKHCQRLYLTSGINSKPKIFKLKTIISNGNNIGVKTINWKAVIGSTHPWCRCTLEHLPNGYKWSEKTNTFEPVRAMSNRKSKIKITITKE